MDFNEATNDNAGGSQRRRKNFWPVAALYALCSLAGALGGRQFYSTEPISLTPSLVFSDQRHLGAVFGAFLAALIAVLLRNQIRRWPSRRQSQATFLLAAAGVGYVLCAGALALGILTLITLSVPWAFILWNRTEGSKDAG